MNGNLNDFIPVFSPMLNIFSSFHFVAFDSVIRGGWLMIGQVKRDMTRLIFIKHRNRCISLKEC